MGFESLGSTEKTRHKLRPITDLGHQTNYEFRRDIFSVLKFGYLKVIMM